jgi:hypothetical protein
LPVAGDGNIVDNDILRHYQAAKSHK